MDEPEPEWLKALDPERQAYYRELEEPLNLPRYCRYHFSYIQMELLALILAELREIRSKI